MTRAPKAAVAVLAVGVLALGTLGLRHMTYLPILDTGGAAIHQAGALPRQIGVCGRDWSEDAVGRYFTLDQMVVLDGSEPAIVDPGPLAACPAGACTVAAGGACDTVIFVRVAKDAYVGYELQGGP